MRTKNAAGITAAESEHMARVKSVACAVCDAPPPSIAHHIEQGLHRCTVALCEDCHVGSHNGIHGGRAMWRVMHMTELKALNITLTRVDLLAKQDGRLAA